MASYIFQSIIKPPNLVGHSSSIVYYFKPPEMAGSLATSTFVGMQIQKLIPTLILLAAAGLASVIPTASDITVGRHTPCVKFNVRKEWRTLSESERLDFISAVKCLQETPGETTALYSGVKSRYDDYVVLHITQTDYIHWVGFFLPWHRYFLSLFEQELQDTCGYNGTVPYWDWTQDAINEAAFVASPLFDTTHGFGGNGPYIEDISGFPSDWLSLVEIPGRTGGGCITDGPFATYNASMGPGNHTDYTPHCVRRDFSPSLAVQSLNSSVYAHVLAATNFFELEHRTEGISLGISAMSLHGGGHLGVGGGIGDMSNTYSSPSDPLFWLHHGGLDKMWNEWQRNDWATRRFDIGGPDTQWAYPFNFFGDIPYKNVTLEFVMDFGQIGNSTKIKEVMDTQQQLCYTYI
ncbi:hypothetical protein BKA67DRAFT_575316 [Truncatella angustata]|uniref:Tyrosinase copper-binding domain-containing protein n=1 Tax=Truncatella angustata TaxID=152316 RepID=A0A9P8UEQ7_9PEZI|nr:uncharacterized protein BKA67DRAFT_575316 [Truncatella angustata]KAH6648602.1 hypothetical protein BKA67DRAFT_575316 [Truncatella angustata]